MFFCQRIAQKKKCEKKIRRKKKSFGFCLVKSKHLLVILPEIKIQKKNLYEPFRRSEIFTLTKRKFLKKNNFLFHIGRSKTKR